MNWAVLIIPIARRAFPWASTPPGVNRPRLTKTRITATTAATPAKIIQRRRRLAAPPRFLAVRHAETPAPPPRRAGEDNPAAARLGGAHGFLGGARLLPRHRRRFGGGLR